MPSSPEWRNWQTHGTQNPALLATCGFDPHLRHHPNHILATLNFSKTGLVTFMGLLTCFPVLSVAADGKFLPFFGPKGFSCNVR